MRSTQRCKHAFISLLFVVAAAGASDISAESCNATIDLDLTESDSTGSDLHLLQRNAQVIRKSGASKTNESAAQVVIVKQADAKVMTPVPTINAAAVDPAQKHRADMLWDNKKRRGPVDVPTHFLPTPAPVPVKVPSPAQPPVEVPVPTAVPTVAPTTAPPRPSLVPWFILGACGIMVIIAAAVWVILSIIEASYSQTFGEIIEAGIEAIADDVLGLDVSYGSLQVRVLKGSVLIIDLKIANPPNSKAACFLHADTLDVRLNLLCYVWKHFFSKIKQIHVDAITFKDVHLNIEREMWSSNVHDILAVVQGTKPKPDRIKGKPKKRVSESGFIAQWFEGLTTEQEDNEADCEMNIRRLAVADVSASVPFLGRIPVPTILYKDFNKETDGKATTARPIAIEILKGLCEKVVTLQQH